MAKTNPPPPPDHSGVDSFLSSALEPDAPARLEAAFRFAELDIRQAQEVMVIIPADEAATGGYSLNVDVLAALRGEIQAWFKALRDQGLMVTDLLSVSVRDQSARQVIQRLLDKAYKAPSKAWMTALPTGKQIVIAPSAVVNSVGFEGVSQVAHERAIRTAQACGKPFNSQALAHYQSLRPAEMA